MNRLFQAFRSADVEAELVLQLDGSAIHEGSAIGGVLNIKAAHNRVAATISAVAISLTGTLAAEVRP